jgi:hypothetical protein
MKTECLETRVPVSMRSAINEKCRDCIYDPLAPGNWRQQVQACVITTCPLWPLRPKSKPRTRALPTSS